MVKTTKRFALVKGAFTYDDSRTTFRRLGRFRLIWYYNNKRYENNYKSALEIDLSPYLKYPPLYSPIAKTLHSNRLCKGPLRDDGVYGYAGILPSPSKIFYDSSLKEEIDTSIKEGEATDESWNKKAIFSPYANTKFGEVNWIDEEEGTFYYRPVLDGTFFKYDSPFADQDNEDIIVKNLYVLKEYTEKAEDVGDCFAYLNESKHPIKKYKLLRSEITKIELLEIPVVLKKSCAIGQEVLKLFSDGTMKTFVIPGKNEVRFDFLYPIIEGGGGNATFSLTEEGEKTTSYDCTYSYPDSTSRYYILKAENRK